LAPSQESELIMKIESQKAGGKSEAKKRSDISAPAIETESWLQPHPNFRLKKLLVPIDFSEVSTKALQYAIAFAREYGSELILLHVVQPALLIPEGPVAMMELETRVESEAAARLRQLEKGVKGIPCRSLVCVGSAAKEVVAEADRQEVDAIVMATHGRTGLARTFIGSVAEKVIRNADCPVLVVRDPEREFVVVQPDDPALNRIPDFNLSKQTVTEEI
jgi:universal stress protein A